LNIKLCLRRTYLLLLLPIIALAICGVAVWSITAFIYRVTVQLPDATEFNPRVGVEFGEVSKKSLLTITGCQKRKVVTTASGRQYALGEPLSIHIMPNTQMLDGRGRWFPVATTVAELQPGQSIAVRMQDVPVMLGEGITAATITILADGIPEPCSLHWLSTPTTTP
jgi:hypothetical protein